MSVTSSVGVVSVTPGSTGVVSVAGGVHGVVSAGGGVHGVVSTGGVQVSVGGGAVVVGSGTTSSVVVGSGTGSSVVVGVVVDEVLDDVLELLQVTAVPPFELDVDGHRAAVRQVHEEAKGVALTLDDGRGQRAAPRRGPDPLEGGVHGGLVGDVLAHGREHGPQRGLRHLTVLAAPVPPVGVDALGGGEGAQVRRVGHGVTLAQAHGCCPPGSRG